MRRIARFVRNAGPRGALMSAVLLGAVAWLLIAHPEKNDARIILPTLAVSFFGIYPLRGVLVGHPQATRRVLAGAVAAAALGVFILGRAPERSPGSGAGAIAVSAFAGLYLGCLFWLLSDARIERGEE